MRVAFLKRPLPGPRRWAAHLLGSAVDHTPYSHGQLIFSNGMSGSAWANGGVQIKSLEYDDGWDFYTAPGIDEAKAHKWFSEHKGAPYDHFGCMRFGLSLLKESPTRYYCWESIVASFGWSEAWRYGPGLTLARLKDEYGSVQVEGPWDKIQFEEFFA